jgi:hypothetical protein
MTSPTVAPGGKPTLNLNRFVALGLVTALGLVVVPPGSAASLFDPTATTDGLTGSLGVGADGLPAPQLPNLTTVYLSGILFYVDPNAIDGGGRVLYVSGPLGAYVSVDRMTGGTDGVKVKAGPYMQATYSESNDAENDTWNSFAMSVGNNVWMVVAADPENLEHYAVLGWYASPMSGNVGEKDLDAWAGVCVVVKCSWLR